MSKLSNQERPRRARSPPRTYDASADYRASNGSTTLPLSINRSSGPSRPMTPSSGFHSTNTTSPARPLRSNMRPRQLSQYSQSGRTISIDTSTSSRPGTPEGSRMQHNDEPIDRNGETSTSPTAMAAITAFQQAGAFRKRAMTNGSLEDQRTREQELQEEMKRQKRIRDKVPGMRINGRSRTAGDVDAVLDQIKDEWDMVIDPDYNSVDLALQLLDEAPNGKDIQSFRQTKELLSRALKGSVDRHHQAFAAALPHHSSLLNHLSMVQTQISSTRTSLQEARDALGNKRPDLVQLWARGQTVEEMLRLLDEIENLKTVPDTLETLIAEKRLVQASALLVRSLKTINKAEMQEIGAVSDLRTYLIGQETSLKDILVDELQSHLYLKSFWCETRWASYIPNQQTLPRIEYDNETLSANLDSRLASSSRSHSSRLSRYLDDLAIRSNDPPIDLARLDSLTSTPLEPNLSGDPSMDLNSSHNPEADSFLYMESLLEALAILGRLGSSLDVVAQRLPIEIYSLVDRTLNEIEERLEVRRRYSAQNGSANGRPSSVYVFAGGNSSHRLFIDASSLRLASLESSEKQADHEILRDLFWTLFSKLHAVTQGLRVVYEVSNRIGSRRDFKDTSGAKPGNLFPLVEMWMPIQSEVRLLLNDYVNDEETGLTSGRNPIASINEILREGKYVRGRGKQIFRFADTTTKASNKVLRPHEDELTRVLRETVPGLVQSSSDGSIQSTLSQIGTEDRLLGTGRHRVLVTPDALHVSVLFQPTLTFLDSVAEVLPSGLEFSRASNAVLDEFVLNVYLPQVEEKTSLLFHQAVTSPQAFQPDPASHQLSPQPLIKASTQLMALINSLCVMLRTTPFHRESYGRLILSVIIQFYQRCSDRFHALVSRSVTNLGDDQLALAAQWAQRSDLSSVLVKLNMMEEKISRVDLCAEETGLELNWLADNTVQKDALLPSVRVISSLSHLYRSTTWFIEKLNSLKSISDDGQTPGIPITPMSAGITYTSTSSPSEPLRLPLSREMALRFDALLKTYEQFAELVLHTIRIDIRCRVIHYLDQAVRHGNYRIDREVGEPDSRIVELNVDLNSCDEAVSSALPEKERNFIFEGVDNLMEKLLISNARFIRAANEPGIKKIFRNILALRQNLRTLSSTKHDSEFMLAKRFYDLFSMGPERLIQNIRAHQEFTFDEYRAMLCLQCGVDQRIGDASSQAKNRNFSMYMIELDGLEFESSGGN